MKNSHVSPSLEKPRRLPKSEDKVFIRNIKKKFILETIFFLMIEVFIERGFLLEFVEKLNS